ncbi:MAG: nuclear transport factor 2 family protein [Bauldia sp.]
MSDSATLKLLERFADAWNAHDVEILLECMTDDGVFYSSAGPAPSGTTFAGREALRKGFSAVWELYPDAQWTKARHFASGADACSQWIFVGTKRDGTRVEVFGCDVFTIRDGKIAVKNAWRKQIQ